MNVELRRQRTSWLGEVARAANDNTSTRPAPSRPRALIYRPAKSAMTSGRAGTRRWVLEFEPQSAPFIEPLMGWTGSTDPLAYIRLSFPSRETAIRYAQRRGLAYEVRDARPVSFCRTLTAVARDRIAGQSGVPDWTSAQTGCPEPIRLAPAAYRAPRRAFAEARG